jgi:hypothetical protein
MVMPKITIAANPTSTNPISLAEIGADLRKVVGVLTIPGNAASRMFIST